MENLNSSYHVLVENLEGKIQRTFIVLPHFKWAYPDPQ